MISDPNVSDVTSVAYDWAADNVYFIEGSGRSRIGKVLVKLTYKKFQSHVARCRNIA